MRPTVVTKSLAAASANNIATSQTISGASAVTLNGSTVSGGVATLDTARRVLISSGGNDSSITFTVTGTQWDGQTISQTVTGSNGGTVATNLDFLTVTKIVTSGSTASTITVGTNTVGDTPWVRIDY